MKIQNITACVFDAYGTLFDVNAAAAHCKNELGENWEALADVWRVKQLNYTWLRSLMGEYVGFSQVTEDALDFARLADQPSRAVEPGGQHDHWQDQPRPYQYTGDKEHGEQRDYQ